MSDLALHHFFVLTEPGAKAADQLVQAGLVEGPASQHPGQGTANRRFFLANTTVELLYVGNEEESMNGPARDLRFPERSQSKQASPFGLVFRDGSPGEELPFPGWYYCPQYFESDQCFLVGNNSALIQEPLCICMPRNLSESGLVSQPDNPDTVLTGLKISLPLEKASKVLNVVDGIPPVSFELNQPNLIEIELDYAACGHSLDLRPELPVVLKW